MPILTATADAVVAALTAAPAFDPPIAPQRTFDDLPRKLTDLADGELRVEAVPIPRLESDREDRGSVLYKPQTNVVVRQKFGPNQRDDKGHIRQEEIDTLVALVEAIHLRLMAVRIGAGDEAAWEDEQILGAYTPSQLRDPGLFLAYIRLTNRVVIDLP